MAAFVQSYGLQLLDRSGKDFDAQQLTSSDVIAFYFSAHWCPPCQHFTPVLKKFYDTLHSIGERSLKIIFVSSDKSEPEMWKYMYEAHGDWLVLKYASTDLKDRLSRQFQVSGIPQLIVIDAVGRQAVRDARQDVMGASSSTQVLTTYHTWKTAAGATSAPQADSVAQLPFGARVLIRGLQGKPENNGLEGVVQSFDASQRRYVVNVAERSLSLKAANLLQLLKLQVKTSEEPHEEDPWNEAEVAEFDEETGDLLCSISGSEKVKRRLEPAQLRLSSGALVAVHGLKGGKEWNEQNGKVVDFDETTQRYTVQMTSDKSIKIKMENMRLCPLA
ncbi:unnamed protein product [Cladocopium goreaui]|uniref:Nucleoredoxin-like protein 2 n=1 Tax=Cladocopium goreaui TaxID=2562237 RepID=A0A9P1D0L9_9DINO|nr:unnamed protein product [Cladocopium goreaui]